MKNKIALAFIIGTLAFGVKTTAYGADLTSFETQDQKSLYFVYDKLIEDRAADVTITEVDKIQSQTEIDRKEEEVKRQEEAKLNEEPPLEEQKEPPLEEQIVSYADSFLGRPYIWGGTSLTNGADCSGFVGQVMAHFNLLNQKTASSHGYTSVSLRSVGVAVPSLKSAKAGDIICYEGHVAIYDGRGRIVEALNPKAGIVHKRKATDQKIITIRRMI